MMVLDETKRGNAECATIAKQQAIIDALVEAMEDIREANNPIWVAGRIVEALALAKETE